MHFPEPVLAVPEGDGVLITSLDRPIALTNVDKVLREEREVLGKFQQSSRLRKEFTKVKILFSMLRDHVKGGSGCRGGRSFPERPWGWRHGCTTPGCPAIPSTPSPPSR